MGRFRGREVRGSVWLMWRQPGKRSEGQPGKQGSMEVGK
jgi:hypothetical protein